MSDGLTYMHNPANADEIILPQFSFFFFICMNKDIDANINLTMRNIY